MSAAPTPLRPRVLIADAAPLTRWALERAFASEGFETCTVSGCEELLEHVLQRRDSLIVSASRFDDDDVMPVLRRIAHASPDLRVIVLGGPDDGASGDAPANLIVVEQPFSVADLLRIANSAAATARSA